VNRPAWFIAGSFTSSIIAFGKIEQRSINRGKEAAEAGVFCELEHGAEASVLLVLASAPGSQGRFTGIDNAVRVL
jgi:hypothetical protein